MTEPTKNDALVREILRDLEEILLRIETSYDYLKREAAQDIQRIIDKVKHP